MFKINFNSMAEGTLGSGEIPIIEATDTFEIIDQSQDPAIGAPIISPSSNSFKPFQLKNKYPSVSFVDPFKAAVPRNSQLNS